VGEEEGTYVGGYIVEAVLVRTGKGKEGWGGGGEGGDLSALQGNLYVGGYQDVEALVPQSLSLFSLFLFLPCLYVLKLH
jgi:hypothetical protein